MRVEIPIRDLMLLFILLLYKNILYLDFKLENLMRKKLDLYLFKISFKLNLIDKKVIVQS